MSAVTACSGGDDAAPTTTVSSTVAATTTEATTTTAAPTTPPPTTTAPTPTTAPPTAPSTTPAPVSTAPLDPIADLAAALQRDAQAAEATLFQMLADPFAVDAEDRLRAVFAVDSLDAVLDDTREFPSRQPDRRGESRSTSGDLHHRACHSDRR